MTALHHRWLRLVGLGVGLFLVGAYGVWLWTEPRGPFEFAYAPFGPEPLPYAPMRGFTYEQLWGHVFRAALLGPGLLLLSWVLWSMGRGEVKLEPRRMASWGAALCCAVTAWVMLGILRGRAIVDDELAYAMQATFLSNGSLTGPDVGFKPPDVFTVSTHLGYTGKYTPGEPLLQVPGVLAGVPALMHLPLLALALWAWFCTLRLAGGERVAGFGAAALALSPMLMATTATGLSHITALTAIILAGLGVAWVEHDRTVIGGALCAFGLGACLITRPQSALPAAAVLGPLVLWRIKQKRHLGALVATTAVGALMVSGFCVYNAALSGSPWGLPWFLQCAGEHYGFGPVWSYDTFQHTPWTALENLAVVAVRLNAWWLGLPIGLAVVPLWWRLRRRMAGQGRWFALGLAVIAFEAGYYSTGVSDTGAVYHFELLLPGSIMLADVVDALILRFGKKALGAIVLHLVLGTGVFLGEQILRLDRLVTAVHRDSDAALARIQAPAVLLYEHWPAEVRRLGWVMDPFPVRLRSPGDPIVTFPRVPPKWQKRLFEAYPGRACWYYHRRADSGEPELLSCQQAEALLRRPVVAEEYSRPLWTPPTAYRLTPFDPWRAAHARAVRDSRGRPRAPCCTFEEMKRWEAVLPQQSCAECLPEGGRRPDPSLCR